MRRNHFHLLVVTLAAWLVSFGVSNADFQAGTYDDGESAYIYQPWIVTSENPPTGGAQGVLAPATPLPAVPGGNHQGVGQLTMGKLAGNFVCTASLMPSGIHVLTAAHCVTDGLGNVDAVTAANNMRFDTTGGPLNFGYTAANITVHPGYNGSTLNGFDVAVIRLNSAVPASVPRYNIVAPGAFGPVAHTKVGYGRGGHGTTGTTTGAGTKRTAQNQWNSPGLGALGVGGITNNNTQLTFDFDNGLAANDAFGFYFGINNVGLGAAVEGNTAPGDSGGPSFVGGQIYGVTSYGLKFTNLPNSDVDAALNSSFGEFSVDASLRDPGMNQFVASTGALIVPPTNPIPEATTMISWVLMAVTGVGLAWYRRREV